MKRFNSSSQAILTCVAIVGLGACSKPSAEGGSETQAEATNAEAPAAETSVDNASLNGEAVAEAGNQTQTEDTNTATPVNYAGLKGDVAAGKAAYIQCKVCHALEEGKPGLGPSLYKVIGKPAGAVAGYSYSAAMKSSGITWTEDKISAYIEKPQTVVPGTKMSFAGYTDPQKRADLIAWLKANGGS